MKRLFEIFFLCECKIQFFFLRTKCGLWGMETELWRLVEVAKGEETVSRGLEGILRIRRLRSSFRGAHSGTAPPPLLGLDWKFMRVKTF